MSKAPNCSLVAIVTRMPSISLETATVLAQIFPVFLLAIFVEERFTGAGIWSNKVGATIALIVRFFGTVGIMIASLACLTAVILQDTSGVDVAVVIGFWSIVGSLAVMIGDVIGQQLQKLFE